MPGRARHAKKNIAMADRLVQEPRGAFQDPQFGFQAAPVPIPSEEMANRLVQAPRGAFQDPQFTGHPTPQIHAPGHSLTDEEIFFPYSQEEMADRLTQSPSGPTFNPTTGNPRLVARPMPEPPGASSYPAAAAAGTVLTGGALAGLIRKGARRVVNQAAARPPAGGTPRVPAAPPPLPAQGVSVRAANAARTTPPPLPSQAARAAQAAKAGGVRGLLARGAASIPGLAAGAVVGDQVYETLGDLGRQFARVPEEVDPGFVTGYSPETDELFAPFSGTLESARRGMREGGLLGAGNALLSRGRTGMSALASGAASLAHRAGIPGLVFPSVGGFKIGHDTQQGKLEELLPNAGNFAANLQTGETEFSRTGFVDAAEQEAALQRALQEEEGLGQGQEGFVNENQGAEGFGAGPVGPDGTPGLLRRPEQSRTLEHTFQRDPSDPDIVEGQGSMKAPHQIQEFGDPDNQNTHMGTAFATVRRRGQPERNFRFRPGFDSERQEIALTPAQEASLADFAAEKGLSPEDMSQLRQRFGRPVTPSVPTPQTSGKVPQAGPQSLSPAAQEREGINRQLQNRQATGGLTAGDAGQIARNRAFSELTQRERRILRDTGGSRNTKDIRERRSILARLERARTQGSNAHIATQGKAEDPRVAAARINQRGLTTRARVEANATAAEKQTQRKHEKELQKLDADAKAELERLKTRLAASQDLTAEQRAEVIRAFTVTQPEAAAEAIRAEFGLVINTQ